MAIAKQEIEALIADQLEGAQVRATDLTGTEDHWGLEIEWAGFSEMPLFQQHRRVMDILAPHLEVTGSGIIHAVDIKTRPGAAN